MSRFDDLDALMMSGQLEPKPPDGSLNGCGRPAVVGAAWPSTKRQAVYTGALVGLAVVAGCAVVVIAAAEAVWGWVDGVAERLVRRPSGRVVATYDGRA